MFAPYNLRANILDKDTLPLLYPSVMASDRSAKPLQLLIFFVIGLHQVLSTPLGALAAAYRWPNLDWHLKYEAGTSQAKYFEDLADLKKMFLLPGGGESVPQPWNLHALDCGTGSKGIDWLVTTYMTSCTNQKQITKSFFHGIKKSDYAKKKSVAVKVSTTDNFGALAYQLDKNNKLTHLMVWPNSIFHDSNIPEETRYNMVWDPKLQGKVLRCGPFVGSRKVYLWMPKEKKNAIYSVYGKQGDRLDTFGIFEGPGNESGMCTL